MVTIASRDSHCLSRSQGTSISVHGLLSSAAGTLIASYSVDGATPTLIVLVNGSQEVDSLLVAVNQRLYYRKLSSGQHSLDVKVVEASGEQAS